MCLFRRVAYGVGHFAFSVMELILYIFFVFCISAVLAVIFMIIIWLSALGIVDGPGSIPGN